MEQSTESLDVGGVHLWGGDCPCNPTPNADGSLRHHCLDGSGWTERAPETRHADRIERAKA